MTATARLPLRVVLHEGPGSRPLAPERRYSILKALLEGGFAVSSVQPGGELSPADESDILVLRETDGDSPAEEREELDGRVDGVTGVRVRFRELDGHDAAAVVEIVEEVRRELELPRNDGWKPWFPVIDYDRCTNCMQCLSFCLFDVYGVDTAGQIEVRNQSKCKTNCPACSRVCPEVAILFPKYGSGPINGDEVRKEDVDREKMKVDISALLGGDIYSMLRDRHARAASRFSKERDESKALKERMRCLAQLRESLDIPDEVLMALPDADQIRRKAEEKAREARRESE